jgi:hypothetical protein
MHSALAPTLTELLRNGHPVTTSPRNGAISVGMDKRDAYRRTSALRLTNWHCVPAPRGDAARPIALPSCPGFASLARIYLTCFNIPRSCGSPKKAKANVWSLTEKLM